MFEWMKKLGELHEKLDYLIGSDTRIKKNSEEHFLELHKKINLIETTLLGRMGDLERYIAGIKAPNTMLSTQQLRDRVEDIEERLGKGDKVLMAHINDTSLPSDEQLVKAGKIKPKKGKKRLADKLGIKE